MGVWTLPLWVAPRSLLGRSVLGAARLRMGLASPLVAPRSVLARSVLGPALLRVGLASPLVVIAVDKPLRAAPRTIATGKQGQLLAPARRFAATQRFLGCRRLSRLLQSDLELSSSVTDRCRGGQNSTVAGLS